MLTTERLRETSRKIYLHGVSMGLAVELIEALAEARRGMSEHEFGAVLRGGRFDKGVWAGTPGRGGNPVTDARRELVRFLLSEFEGSPPVPLEVVRVFTGVGLQSVRRDQDALFGAAGRWSENSKSLATALKRAEPKTVDIRQEVRSRDDGNDHLDLALSVTLEQIGKTRDVRRYAGLVREIGKVLA